MKNEKQFYETITLNVVEIKVESGYATSGENLDDLGDW